MGTTSRKSGGDRKHGRSEKKPTHLRYNMERRWEINKEKKAAKVAKRIARQKLRKS